MRNQLRIDSSSTTEINSKQIDDKLYFPFIIFEYSDLKNTNVRFF